MNLEDWSAVISIMSKVATVISWLLAIAMPFATIWIFNPVLQFNENHNSMSTLNQNYYKSVFQHEQNPTFTIVIPAFNEVSNSVEYSLCITVILIILRYSHFAVMIVAIWNVNTYFIRKIDFLLWWIRLCCFWKTGRKRKTCLTRFECHTTGS